MTTDEGTGEIIPRPTKTVVACALGVLLGALIVAGCSDDRASDPPTAGASTDGAAAGDFDGLVEIDVGRSLYLRCTGTGSPTVVLESGDEDTSDSYGFAESSLAAVTLACVYDRANLGGSDPDQGPRQLADLVADVEGWLEASGERGPYVLVGTSGGGYISVGYAVRNASDVAGIVLVEVPAPFRDPPRVIVDETRWNHHDNLEQRDYLRVEKDAWAARREIGDIPVTVISNRYSADEIAASPLASERRGMRTNVREQRGWLALSPQAEQVVVSTGHAVEEADPQFVIDAILGVVAAARGE